MSAADQLVDIVRRRPLLGLAAFGVAAFVVIGALQRLNDVLFHPWALATPPLLDRWTGQLVLADGTRLAVTLDLHRADTDECHNCAEIEGRATTCSGPRDIHRYDVSGSPRDRHAQTMLLGTRPEADPPPEGLELNTLRGRWNGADRLTLEATFVWRPGPAGSRADDPDNQRVALDMVRADAGALDAACR